ncbi:hypothetical protein GCM10008966_31510 [Rhodovulum strictum]
MNGLPRFGSAGCRAKNWVGRGGALAEAGATPHQIAVWTGHVTLEEAEHCTRATQRQAAVMGEEQEQNVANSPAQSANATKKRR